MNLLRALSLCLAAGLIAAVSLPAQAAAGPGRACADCPETVTLPAGSFEMGSPASEAERSADEGPVRTVRIGHALEVGKTHVTRREFAAFVNATGYRTEAEQGDGCTGWTGSTWAANAGFNWRKVGFDQNDDHPVVCVSWNDAQRYIAWLNERSPVKGWRLLTESEWEYAARAGTTTRYAWGLDADHSQQCQNGSGADAAAKRSAGFGWPVAACDDGQAYTGPVARFKPNGWGLFDMAGNVWQWTQDCYLPSYEVAPVDGSAVNAGPCEQRALRGGSWASSPHWLRSATRYHYPPTERNDVTGFRLARTVPPARAP